LHQIQIATDARRDFNQLFYSQHIASMRYDNAPKACLPNSLDKTEKLRSWWWRRQGFDPATLFSSPIDVLKQSGWSRSVGGCAPYLTLFSRAGISREATDKAVENLEIHELPSARACTYVVPADDYVLALTLAQGFGSGDMRVAEKLGVTQKEVDKLSDGGVGRA
jgi:hypothetical protein